MLDDRIKYLESRFPKGQQRAIEEKYWPKFTKQSSYAGNGVYQWMDIHATDTRELFLMGCLHLEKIEFKKV